MAVNLLGELENAPGAAKRESAHFKRRFVEAAGAAVDSKRELARILAHNARVDDRHADIAHYTNQLKKPAFQYRKDAREGFRQASALFKEADELATEVRKQKWSARKDSTVAFLQTIGAKIGLG